MAWVRETSARSLDYVQLAYLADNYAPRIYFRSQRLRPYSTVTMSVYFHASETELEELGDDRTARMVQVMQVRHAVTLPSA